MLKVLIFTMETNLQFEREMGNIVYTCKIYIGFLYELKSKVLLWVSIKNTIYVIFYGRESGVV